MTLGPDRLPGAQQRGLVDQIGLQHGGGEDRPGLDHEPRDATLGEAREHRGEVEPAASFRYPQHLRSGLAQGLLALGRSRRAGDDPQRRLARGRDQPAAEPQPQPAVEHHPHRRAVRHAWEPAGQERIVRQHGADAGQHRIVHGPHQVHARARRLAGDRRRAPAGQAGLAVGGDRELEHDLRAALPHAPDMSRMGMPRRLGTDPDLELDAGLSQAAMARAGDLRVGILERRHHPGDAGRDDRIGARRRSPEMGTGLQGHIEGGAAGGGAGARQRLRLRMGAAAGLASSRARRSRAPSSCGRTTTAPTAGLGQVRPSPRRPSPKASAMK